MPLVSALLLISAACAAAIVFYATDQITYVSSDRDLYLFVGNNLWRGDGLTDVDGALFVAHGPVWPALISLLVELGGNKAEVLTSIACLCAAMVATCWLSYRLSGPLAATITSILLIASPVLWTELSKVSIDQIQAMMILVFLLLLWRQEWWNFTLAGCALGAILLTKESAAFLVFAPLALWPFMGSRVFATRYALFLAVVLATAGWWWVVVWEARGTIFPLQQLAEVKGDTSLSLSTYLLFGLFLIGWTAFARLFWMDPRGRLVLFTGLAILPPTLIALASNMDERQFISFSLLSSLAFGAGSVQALGGRRSMVAATLLFPLIFLFPTSLGTNGRNDRRSDRQRAGLVLKKRVEDVDSLQVLTNLPSGLEAPVRSIALYGEKATFPRPFGPTYCRPCSLEMLKKSGFFTRLYGPEKTLMIQQLEPVAKILSGTSGFSLLWRTPDRNIAIFAIDHDLLPPPTQLKQRLSKVLNRPARADPAVKGFGGT